MRLLMLIPNVNLRPGGIRTTLNPMSFNDSCGTWTRVCAEQRTGLPTCLSWTHAQRTRPRTAPSPRTHLSSSPPGHRGAPSEPGGGSVWFYAHTHVDGSAQRKPSRVSGDPTDASDLPPVNRKFWVAFGVTWSPPKVYFLLGL